MLPLKKTIILLLVFPLLNFALSAQDYSNKHLLNLAELIKKAHPIFANQQPIIEWEKLIRKVSKSNRLSKEDYAFYLTKMVAFAKDPHTRIKNLNSLLDPVPLFIKYFDDGWRIIGTNKPNKQMLGNKLICVNDIPIDSIISKLSNIMPCDNVGCIKTLLPEFVYFPQLLFNLQLGGSFDSMKVEIENDESDVELFNLNTIPFEVWKKEALFFSPKSKFLNKKNSEEPIWLETIDKDKLAYIRINSFTGSKGKFKKIANELSQLKAKREVNKILFDIRNNLGGQVQLGYPIIKALLEIESMGLQSFMAIDHNSFSAAIVFVELANKYAKVEVIGGSYGDVSNHFSEPLNHIVEDVNLKISIATKYYHNIDCEDSSLKDMKHIPVKFEDYRLGNDPILDFVKTTPIKENNDLNRPQQVEIITKEAFPVEYQTSYCFYLAQQSNVIENIFNNRKKAIALCKEGLTNCPDSPYLLGTLGLMQIKNYNPFGLPKVVKSLYSLKKLK